MVFQTKTLVSPPFSNLAAIGSLRPSSSSFCGAFFFSFVLAWLEVFLAFLASHEALPIAVCSLSRPKSQVQHQGSIIRLVFSTVSVADFVKGLRLDLFKSISTFLQQT